ncbi:hypothetical protein TNCV_2323751 [Trichonephila clavipes]|nr:hypothetical protein TNCV_2323751 [Trichonephila clavipes]
MVGVYEDQALSMKCVYECFRENGGSASGNSLSGRPVATISDENIKKLRKLIPKDRRFTMRLIIDELQIN